MSNFFEKYIKYKSKYIDIKKNLIGGKQKKKKLVILQKRIEIPNDVILSEKNKQKICKILNKWIKIYNVKVTIYPTNENVFPLEYVINQKTILNKKLENHEITQKKYNELLYEDSIDIDILSELIDIYKDRVTHEKGISGYYVIQLIMDPFGGPQ